MRHSFALSLALTLALPLLSATRSASAAEPTTILQAIGEKEPLVISWVDTADNKVGLDGDFADTIADLLADVVYVFRADDDPQTFDQVLLGKLEGGQFKTVVPVLQMIRSSSNKFFIFHGRSVGTESTLIIDGSLFIFTSDPTSGLATMTMHLIHKNGEMTSTYVEQDVKLQGSSTPTPAPIPTPRG
jgi:hypothetical protein